MGIFTHWPYTNVHELNLDWVLETVKKLADEWKAYHTDWESWKNDTQAAYDSLYQYVINYFNNLDVNEEISSKLDAMVEDGTFSTLLEPFFTNITNRLNVQGSELNALSSRMDTFVNLPEGSTTGDAELIDIRVGYNGTTYPTAGDSVRSQVTDIQKQLTNNKIDLVPYLNRANTVSQGLTYTWNDDGSCTVSGTATGTSMCNLFVSQTELPYGFKPGEVYKVEYNSQNVDAAIYDYSVSSVPGLYVSRKSGYFIIPESCSGIIIRFRVLANNVVNETIKLKIFKYDGVLESVDTASQDETGKFNMRPIMQYLLQKYKYCRLGVGDFYINDVVQMPEDSTIEGCGEATKIRLTSGERKVAIDIRKHSSIRNLTIIGNYADLTESDFTDTRANRFGIRYSKYEGETHDTRYSNISNVTIINFSGSGIFQYNTGGAVSQGLYVSDVRIENCWAGIEIYANSEFGRYSNVQIAYCYVACINNGGNNVFSNCQFNAYHTGMRIDGTKVNSAHGTCSNSTFCHIGHNNGIALELSDIANGFIFDSNQYWYNSIVINNCSGLIFSDSEIDSRSVSINITNGNTILFNGCMFMYDDRSTPDITVTGNNKVKLVNCYGSMTGEPILL